MFHVVLHQPEIPANTGNIARTCLATGASLHLVRPLGFRLDDRSLLRAGLDYWREVNVRTWDSLDDLFAAHAGTRYFLTTKAARPYFEARYQPGDLLVFGRETRGLPEPVLEANRDRLLTIPMKPGARSLNLAVAAAVVLYEAIRQCGG